MLRLITAVFPPVDLLIGSVCGRVRGSGLFAGHGNSIIVAEAWQMVVGPFTITSYPDGDLYAYVAGSASSVLAHSSQVAN
jgi:hypothetical protein